MARLIPPEKVIRLRRSPPPSANWGFKWHFVEPSKRRLTVCKIVIVGSRPNPPRWEVARLEDVKPKNICKVCLGGMVAE